MKFFNRHRLLLTAIGIVILVIGATIVIQIFKEINIIANWLFMYLADWSIILYTFVTFLLVAVAFREIIESRRSRILNEIRIWANESYTALLDTDNLRSTGSAADKVMDSLIRAVTILPGAARIGGEVERTVDNARKALSCLATMKVKTVSGEARLSQPKMKLTWDVCFAK